MVLLFKSGPWFDDSEGLAAVVKALPLVSIGTMGTLSDPVLGTDPADAIGNLWGCVLVQV